MSQEERDHQQWNWRLHVEGTWHPSPAHTFNTHLDFEMPADPEDDPEELINVGIGALRSLQKPEDRAIGYTVTLRRVPAETPAAERQAVVREAIPSGT